jgi:hypothetical protein
MGFRLSREATPVKSQDVSRMRSVSRVMNWTPRTGWPLALLNYIWPLLAGLAPWFELWFLPTTPDRTLQHVLIVIGVVNGVSAVGLAAWYIFHTKFRDTPGLVVCGVFYALSYLEGEFAVMYWIWSHTSTPNTVFSAVMSKPDAVYFAISTATATGMGDIHPLSGGARLWVSGQLVLSLFLIVLALGIAVTRLAGRKDREP